MPFLVSTAACLAAAFTNSRFKPGRWYEDLRKPSYTPPDRVFPVAWAVLFVLMALSAGLVWHRVGFSESAGALALFGLQLALNASWSWLFFGRHAAGLALLDMSALWIVVVATAVAFARHDPLAAALLVPYVLWLSLAWLLNLRIWRLNRPWSAVPADGSAA